MSDTGSVHGWVPGAAAPVRQPAASFGAGRVSANKYVTAALSRGRSSISALAQKPRILEQTLEQGRGEAEKDDDGSRLTMPLLGKIWKEMAAHLT